MNYTTSDYHLISFLTAMDVSHVRHYKNGKQVMFEFDKTDELLQLIDDYYADRVKCSPIRFGNALKQIKALIYRAPISMDSNGKTE